jgi:hypothetical protein
MRLAGGPYSLTNIGLSIEFCWGYEGELRQEVDLT